MEAYFQLVSNVALLCGDQISAIKHSGGPAGTRINCAYSAFQLSLACSLRRKELGSGNTCWELALLAGVCRGQGQI